MAKPIFLVGIGDSLHHQHYDHIKKALEEQLYDYHVLVYNRHKEEMKFDVLNAEDMPPLKFDKLQAKIESIIKV